MKGVDRLGRKGSRVIPLTLVAEHHSTIYARRLKSFQLTEHCALEKVGEKVIRTGMSISDCI